MVNSPLPLSSGLHPNLSESQITRLRLPGNNRTFQRSSASYDSDVSVKPDPKVAGFWIVQLKPAALNALRQRSVVFGEPACFILNVPIDVSLQVIVSGHAFDRIDITGIKRPIECVGCFLHF